MSDEDRLDQLDRELEPFESAHEHGIVVQRFQRLPYGDEAEQSDENGRTEALPGDLVT